MAGSRLEKPVAKLRPQGRAANGGQQLSQGQGAREVETEDSRKVYEVRLENASARVDPKIDASGKLIAQEHLLELKTAPVAVTNAALAPPYNEWKIDRVEKIDNLETPTQSGYEVLIEHRGVKREVLLAGDGKLIKIEDADDGEEGGRRQARDENHRPPGAALWSPVVRPASRARPARRACLARAPAIACSRPRPTGLTLATLPAIAAWRFRQCRPR